MNSLIENARGVVTDSEPIHRRALYLSPVSHHNSNRHHRNCRRRQEREQSVLSLSFFHSKHYKILKKYWPILDSESSETKQNRQLFRRNLRKKLTSMSGYGTKP
ncbi:MAG: hypothetical protein ACOYON_05405 [Fimbriimonas sp.]